MKEYTYPEISNKYAVLINKLHEAVMKLFITGMYMDKTVNDAFQVMTEVMYDLKTMELKESMLRERCNKF